MIEGFAKVFSPEISKKNKASARLAIEGGMKVVSKLSGGAMAMKTLGSLGFYVRNVVSNALFFAPAQGFFNLKSMSKSAYKEIWKNAVSRLSSTS